MIEKKDILDMTNKEFIDHLFRINPNVAILHTNENKEIKNEEPEEK